MIVNSPFCGLSQRSGLVIVIELAHNVRTGQTDRWICLPWLVEPVSGLLLAIWEHLLCLFLPHPSSWQEPRVPRIGFWGIFSALYQTCRLLSAVPRLQFREGVLDWQALASAIPGGKGRGICDGCTDSYFSYNFLQAGFRLSGWEKALSA